MSILPFLWVAIAAPLPNIDQVTFPAACDPIPAGTDRALKAGLPGNELQLIRVNTDGTHGAPGDATFPTAVCNDGTPGYYYVRPGTGADADRWVVFLQGGSFCKDWASCTGRWCGNGLYTAEKMSSTNALPTIKGGSIFEPDPERNRFAGWTHVYVVYCSSDAWIGRGKNGLDMLSPNGTMDYQIYMQGADIVDAVMEELYANPDKLSSLGMPSLGDASDLLLTGSSAGGLGVMFNLDHVAEWMSVQAPGATVRGVIDSASWPPSEVINPNGGPYTGLYDPATVSCYQGWGEVAQRSQASLDASCRDAHPFPAETWKCADGLHAHASHTRTPFFVYQDQFDDVFECSTGSHDPATARAHLESLADIADPTVPNREVAPEYVGPTPGWFSSRCGYHQGLALQGNGKRFIDQKVPVGDLAGATVWANYHDLLWNWVEQNGGPTQLMRTADVGALDCPEGPPSPPTRLAASYDTVTDTVTVSWAGANFIDAFELRWADNPSVTATSNPTPVVGELSWDHVAPGLPEICYQVVSQNQWGESPPTDVVCITP